MASAVARAYNSGLGAEPTAGSRGRVPGHGIRGGGEAILKLKKHFWFLDAQWKPQICPLFYNNLETQRNEIFVIFANK